MSRARRITRAAAAIGLLLWAGSLFAKDYCESLGTPKYAPARLPDIRVRVTQAQRVGKGLRFQWVITNESSVAVDVFSTSLSGFAAGWSTDDAEHKLVVATTFTQPFPGGPPNDVPRPEFLRVLPHSSIQGAFDASEPPIDLDGYTSVELVIGYGMDVPRLLRDMNRYYARCGHPFDLLVKWQRLARSQPAGLEPHP